MKNLSYWIFTSGEKGIHGLDWGIKYASPIFTNSSSLDVSYRVLDVKYRALLEEFSLTPRLSRPDDDKVGLLLLPGENNSALLGFIFPSTDHQQRPNTSTLVCVVPKDLKQIMNLSEAVRRIWCSNDIECIAQQNSSERPDFLQFYEDSAAVTKATKILNLNSQLKWPGENDGYIQINERIKKLSRPISRKPQSNNIRKIVITLAGLIVVIMGAIFTTHALIYKKVEVLSAPMILISPDITSPDKKVLQSLPENTVSSNIASKSKETPPTQQIPAIKESEVQSSSLKSQETANVKSTDDDPEKKTSEIDKKISQILAKLNEQKLGAPESFDVVPINNIEVSSDFVVLCSQVMDSGMIKDKLSKLVDLNVANTSKKGEVTFYWRKTAGSKERRKKFLSCLKNESLLSVKNLKPIQNESTLSQDIAQELSLKISTISEKFAVRFFFRTEKDNLYLVYVVKCNSNSMTTERYIAANSANSEGFIPIETGRDPFERINYKVVGLSFKISDSLDKTLDAYLNQFDMRRK